MSKKQLKEKKQKAATVLKSGVEERTGILFSAWSEAAQHGGVCLPESSRDPEVSVTPLGLSDPQWSSTGRSLNRQPAVSLSTRGSLIMALRKPIGAQRTNRNTCQLCSFIDYKWDGSDYTVLEYSESRQTEKWKEKKNTLTKGGKPRMREAKHSVFVIVFPEKLHAPFENEWWKQQQRTLGTYNVVALLMRRKTARLSIR